MGWPDDGPGLRLGSAAVPPGATWSIARRRVRWQNARVGVQITIRDVPVEVRDELAARAARRGKSMQEYLKVELQRLSSRPPVERVLARILERKARAATRVPPEEILPPPHRTALRLGWRLPNRHLLRRWPAKLRER